MHASIEAGANLGFAGGCHVGAGATTARRSCSSSTRTRYPAPGCLDHLRAAAAEHPQWGAWQAAVLQPDDTINTDGGVVHFLGMGWAGDCGKPVSALPVDTAEVAFPSGAAMTVRRTTWDRLGGLDASYFLYGEDLDLGLRIWLSGERVGVVPDAHVVHSYEFEKGTGKWFWLERNRLRTVLSVYPARCSCCSRPRCSPPSSRSWRSPPPMAGWRPSCAPRLAVVAGLPAHAAPAASRPGDGAADRRASSPPA